MLPFGIISKLVVAGPEDGIKRADNEEINNKGTERRAGGSWMLEGTGKYISNQRYQRLLWAIDCDMVFGY